MDVGIYYIVDDPRNHKEQACMWQKPHLSAFILMDRIDGAPSEKDVR